MCFRRSARLTTTAAAKGEVKQEATPGNIKSQMIDQGIKRKRFSEKASEAPSASFGDHPLSPNKRLRAIPSSEIPIDRLGSKFFHQDLLSDSSETKVIAENDLDKAIAHLIKVEPKLNPVIEQYPCHLFSSEKLAQTINPFEELSCSIISQQVSCAAAKTIQNRFIALFHPDSLDTKSHSFPTADQVIRTPIQTIRTAGLSQRKAEYLKCLAEKFHSGILNHSMLLTASYEEVFNALIQVRGLGKWSIEMFACFGLKRMDVFSTGDLGVQRGMALLLGRDVDHLKKKGGKWKYMSENEMEEIANKFQPYRYVLERFRCLKG